MPVLVSREGVPESPIGSRALRRRAERMLWALGRADAELSILLCGDREIHRLNRRYRRKNKPTDVLAFPLAEGAPVAGQLLLGDVVISLETAVRQAERHSHSLWAEVTTLLAHGLLHLVGYDHRDDAEEREMNAKTRELARAAASRSA